MILFYRSLWLAGDTAAIDGLCAALEARGIGALPLFVSSLKDPAARAVVRDALRAQAPDLVITTTAFAAGDGDDLFPAGGPAVLQAIVGTTAFSAWQASPRGLAASDLAMHVVLPELDGRVLAGAISFKDGAAVDPDLAFTATRNRPEPEGIALVAERAARLIALARRPRAQRRLAVLMPDYPGAAGRTGYAVGLDVPESACAVLARLAAEGYDVPPAPAGARALLDSIRPRPGLSLADYRCRLARLPQALQDAMAGAWGDPEEDDDLADGAFAVRCARFGTVTVALAPERGRALDRRADYHDPALPPRHALLAFGLWLQETCDALVHLGAHGTLEWLPGKAAALTPACFPRAVLGALPVAYPFLVSNPGEAAQAKRRIAGVTIGHLPPPMTSAGLGAAEQRLERLVDEYAAADGLDTRRRDRLAGLIVEAARETGLARHAGVGGDTAPDEALKRIDAWLCDVKDLAIKDGQHVFGAASEDGERHASGAAEMAALLTALDGRHVAPGPAGAPARGRRDVLPTGRNLFTADPRSLPSPTAMDLGKLAADEIIRAHLQDHGDYPRAVIIDLWGSATLRTGGEEIAQGLCLMGCRPQWDAATGRVTGIEVLPPAVLGRPRVDVTWRVSGLFRDIFPAQIALLDAAARAVGARSEEAEGDNPLALSLASGGDGARIFGTAPGTYGAGVEERLASGAFTDRAELGQAYLDAASHAYGGAEGAARESGGAFSQRVAQADALIHTSDDAGRDLLDGGADVAFVGGFAAAAALLGKAADLVILDTADPQRPRARPLGEALTRLVHGRVSARFIAGQMRHGPRGASELLETVDRLVAFAETTNMVASDLMDRLHDAYLGDPEVRAFLLRENPAAAREMARRFSDARRRGLWHARRNDLDHDLEALAAEARPAGVTAEAAE
ncbi:MAG: cobaltochelatase subunit CobN [Rhizobiales bacterium 35-68-8]|nr:MAG: cobaltochelatase subunit CobN [Rhizobiales bacterium 35-68-8]